MQVYRGAFLALTAAIIQAGSHRKSINASLLIVHSLSEPPSQSAPSCVEDRDCNEDQGTVSLYPSHFLPCRLFKLRMMLLFVPRFIPGKMVDLAATNSVCGAGTVNTAARAVLQSDNWGEFKGRVWIKCLFGFFFTVITETQRLSDSRHMMEAEVWTVQHWYSWNQPNLWLTRSNVFLCSHRVPADRQRYYGHHSLWNRTPKTTLIALTRMM